jgi:hypothetical protein
MMRLVLWYAPADCGKISQRPTERGMPSTPVQPDQFEISTQGITHKPTGANFTPYPGQPLSGHNDDGRLGDVLPNDDDYRTDQVKSMMQQLWADYVSKNPKLFPRAE